MNTENPSAITVDFVCSPIINFALQQTHVPVIRRFIIKNLTGRDIPDINILLSCEPDIATPNSVRIALLHNEESFELNDVDIKLSAKYLSELTERVAGKIQLSIHADGQLLFQAEYAIEVLAFDQWQGIGILPEM